MFDEQDRQYFYNEFKNNGYEVGSYDDFKKDLNNKEDRDWYYNEAKNMDYDVGTLEDFDKMVLEPAPSSSSGAQQVAASPQSNEKSVSTETKPQVAQPAAKPAAEKPKEDNRSWFTKWMTGSLPEEEKQETADKEPGLIAKALGMIPTGVQTSNGTYQPSPAISQPVVKGEEQPVKEEASPSSSANAASPESKDTAPVTTPTGVVNNEGLMDAKLANYLENWKQRPDKEGTYFENMVADLLADGTANSNEEAVKMVQSALGRYANRSAMDVTNQVVSSLPDDTVQDAEQSIEAQWYSHGVQDKLKQEADNMGISYDDYVGLFLKPAMVQSLVNKYGPNYRNIAEGIATRLYAHDEHVQDRLMNQDINDALSSVISKYVNPSVVDEYNKAQEAGSKAFAEGMEGSQFIPANLRLGTALGAQYEANEAKDPAKVLSGLQQKFGKLYRNPKFLNDMSNAAFKVMQRYGLNGTLSGNPKQFKPMINAAIKNELDQLEIKGMMPKGSAEYIMKTGLGNTIVGKIIRKAVQTDYQNWLEDIANQQYQPGFWENVASGALTFAGDAWSYWLPGAAGGKLTKSMVAKAEGKLAGDLMAKGMERKMAERAAKVLIGKSKAEALKSGAVHGAVTFGGQSAISKPIDEVYRTGQFDENGKIYNPSVGKVIANTLGEVAKQSAVGTIMQGGTIANMVGKGRGLATNILADVGGKVVDSGIMTGQQILERMAHDPNFKPTGKDAAETFLESGANLLSIGFPGFVGKYARFKDAREFNKKFDFTDQDIAELKRFGYDGLRDAFEKVGIGEYAVVGENAQRLDGQLTQKYMDLMNDKSVPEVLKAKMMAVVEGKRPSSFSPVIDSEVYRGDDGKYYLETYNKDGGVIDRKEYSSHDAARNDEKKLEYEKTLGLASVLEGEFHNEFTQEHLEGLYNKAAQKYNMGEKLTDEDKAAVYLHQNAGAIKDIMDKQQKGIILTEEEQKQVDTYRHFYNSALENSSVMREFVNTFEDSHGVARGTLRKALESKDKKYAPLVESYLKELYNSIELKREMKQTMDDLYNTSHGNEQKRIEGENPVSPVEGSSESSAGGQENPVSEGPAPYQDRTKTVPTPSDAEFAANPANVSNSSAEGASPETKVAGSDAFVMGQNAYKNGDSEALQAIDYNSDLATGRLKRAFADNEKMPDIVANAYNEGRDMEQFVAQRASLTPAQKEAISKYVEAMDAKKGAIDALQHADDGYGEALKEQLWPYQTEDGNIMPATLDSGKQVFLKKANEYGGAFVVVPDEQGQPTIKQVSNAEIKEVGTPVPLDEYIESSLAQQKNARNKQFISQFDGSGLKPNDQVTVAMEEGDANINMTFAGYSEDGKIVLTDGKDYLPLSKEEFAAWRKNALDNTINEHLDREDEERELAEMKNAEADKQERYKKGIFGYASGQPDYSDTQTDPKVAAEYLQETAGEDRKALFANIVAEKQALQKRINQLREHIASNEEWLSINADLDPKNAETRTLANKQMEGQIADLQARFDNWNKIRSAVMTPEEAQAIKADRTQKIADAGVNEGDVAPIEGREVAVLSDEELKKQYPTMDEASDFITSERKRIYRIQSDEVQREIDGVDKVLDRYVNGEIDLEPEQIKELNTTKAQLEARQANLTESAKELKAQADKLKTLYRKENMEARAKAVEDMTPAEQRAIKVENAIKNGNMSQLNAIYDDVRGATDFNDTEPNTLEEYVANNIGRFTLNYEGKEKGGAFSNGIQQETGLGRKDFEKLQILAKEGEGKTVPEFVHSLYDDMPMNLKQMGYTDHDIRSAFLDLIGSAQSYLDIKNYTLNNKVANVEQLMRDVERQEEEMMQDGAHSEASFGERLKSAIAETETEPTEAQKKAGNYKKGHLTFGGYDFTVETPKGVTRSGKDEQGKPWSVTMHDTYGYILGKIGVDGDHIDMFINDAADLDTFDGNVYVVDQVTPETGEFDEHKVMYGYPSEETATEAYLANYSKDWKGLGKVTSVPKATFDKWLESSDRKTKPFREYAMIQHEEAKKAKESNEVLPFDAPMNMDDLPFHRDVKEVKPSDMTEAQKVAYDAVSTMLKKAGIPVKVVSNEDMEKVAEAQDNLNLAMLLNQPEMRFKIKTPEEKQAAENAYNFAKDLRPNKWAQYAVVDMSNPNKMPEYYQKQELARKERTYLNRLMWGNYKVFNLDKSFEDNVAGLTGSFPSEFDPYKIDAQTNKKNELKKQIKETEEAYKLTGQERKEYQNQLMKEYMDEHGLASENDIPDDVWREFDYKAIEKYQDKLDSLFAKYKDLDRQLKAIVQPGVQYLKGKGVVYGYTDGKEIVLNKDHLNPNTPIHEYQHLWRTAAKEMNPELIAHGDELIKQTQLFRDLKEDPNYKHLSDDEICDEAFARLTGEDGAAILEQMAKDAIKENPLDTAKELTIINRLKNWLKKYWYWTLDTFTKWKPEDIKKMTLEDIRNLVLRDLANGVDPRTKVSKSDITKENVELEEVNKTFNQRLDELVENPNQKDKILRLGRSSSFLKAGGIADAEIELDFDKLMRKSKQGYVHEHPFDATDVKDLPMAIANPISVFNNTNGRNDGQVILTELKKENRNFIVAIQTENQNRKGGVVLKVNKIVTLFPKDARGVINWFNQGKATNIDKEKALHFIEALQNHSGTTITDEELKSAANIINSFETTKEKGKKFSLEDPKTLAGVHNISEEKLLKAIKQGGLANPSVAVIDTSKQDHKAYGDISLILPSDKIAKRTGKNAGTWQGDAYTPTYPEVEKQISNKGAEKSSSDVLSVPKEMQHEVRNGIDRWLNGGDANSGLKYLFLHEKGNAPKMVELQHKYSDKVYNDLKSITAGNFDISSIGKADAQKVLDMYIDSVFDGDRTAYDEKQKYRIARYKKQVAEGVKNPFLLVRAKNALEQYDKYGFYFDKVQEFVRKVESDHRMTGFDTNATLNNVEDYIKTNNLTDEFNTWLEGKEKEYGIKEVIFDGFTPSGNRRYVPNTLENVSKIMKKQGRNGATGAAVSFQNFAARLMPSYGTLKDIRSKKGLLTSDREKFDKFRDKWSNVFFELGNKCQPDSTSAFDSYGMERLSEAAMTSDPQAYLKKEYNVDFSDADTKRLKDMVKAIKEEHPAMYFETKFERPVRFDEFSAAVVPTTTKKEVKEALKNAGVSIFEYDEKSDADRKRAFNEAVSSKEGIRFMFAGEKGAAEADKAEEKTYRMDNLKVAEEMERGKKDAKAIKLATGWERGADGKWRYEMPDFKADKPITVDADIDISHVGPYSPYKEPLCKLSDLIDDKNLFAAYPSLKNIDILLVGNTDFEGMYDKLHNNIALRTNAVSIDSKYSQPSNAKEIKAALEKFHNFWDSLTGKDKELADDAIDAYGGYTEEELKEDSYFRELEKGNPKVAELVRLENSIPVKKDVKFLGTQVSLDYHGKMALAHEVQHAIQDIEGFAKGGNPEQFQDPSELESQYATFDELVKDKFGNNDAGTVIGIINGSTPEYQQFRSEFGKSWDEYFKNLKGMLGMMNGDEKLFKENYDYYVNEGRKKSAFEQYQSLAGEVEARNVMKRMLMTPGERRNSLAEETEDVNRDEQIVMNVGDTSYSIVKDPETIKKLDKEDTVKVYRAMQVGEDGKLYPPMAAKVKGKFVEPIELGKWEQADERPELADDKGMFTLNKGNGKSLKAAYNPYLHTSRTPLNDQFSEAQNRPNIVTVEVEVPKSELTSGYKADKAKDAVGEVEWKAGIIQGQLTGKRKVVLSRWDKPVRIVPDSEVADVIVNDMFKGKNITMPSNVVTPSLRKELEKRGVPFVETDNRGRIVGGENDGVHYSKVYGKNHREKGYRSILKFSLGDNGTDVADGNGDSKNKNPNKNVITRRIGSREQAQRRVNETLGAAASDLQRSLGATAKEQRPTWNRRSALGYVRRRAEELSSLLTEKDLKEIQGGYIGHGQENYVYQAKYDDKKVVKFNDFSLTDSLFRINEFIDRVNAHNQFQPKDKYTPIGFAYDEKGDFCIVMEQPYLKGTQPTREEITQYLTDHGFKLDMIQISADEVDLGWTNGEFDLWDAEPRNVIKDENGDLHFFDTMIQHTYIPNHKNPLRLSMPSIRTFESQEMKNSADKVKNVANVLGGAEAVTYTSSADVPEEYRVAIELGAKGWYDPTTHTVHVYLPNCADASEAERTVLHEKIGHEGMEVLLGGEDEVRKFANFVYNSVAASTRGKILEIANEYDPDWKKHDRMNVGTQEYIARLAEEGPKTAEDFSLWTKIKHYLIKVLKKLGVRVPGLLNDKDLRYYLMKAGKALHVWDEMPQEKQEAMMKQASNAEIKDSLSDGAGKGKPRQKKGESMIQYMKRVQEWRKWKNAREDENDPEPPMFYDIDKDEAGKKEWALLNKDWRERHHLAGEEPTGLPIRMEGEEDGAYMTRIHEYEKWKEAMKDQEDPMPDMFAFEKKKQEEVKRKYEDWLARHELLEQQQADLDLYEGKIYPAETNPKADDLEQQVMQDLAEVTSTDVSKEGAAKTVKHAVIHRRKNMEEASADDAIYINDVKNRIEKMADSGAFDKLLSDYQGKPNRAEKLAEAIPYIIEAPRRLRDLAHDLNATGAFDKGHIHIQPADVEAIQPYVADLIAETGKKHTELKDDKEVEVYDDPQAVSDVASKMAQVINDNHQGEEGFVPIDGTDILSEHVLPLVKQQIVPEGIDYKNLSPEMKAAIDSIRDWYNYTYDWLKDNRTLKEDTGYNVDYVNHIWDKEKSDKQAYAMYVENRQRTKSPNEKKRTISTLMEGISVGLVPKTTDITKMMAYYSRSNIEAWVNKTVLQELSGLNVIERNEDGEVVSTDPLLSSSAPFNLEQYKYFEIPGVGPVWVYNVSPKQVKVKNPITGKEKVLYSEASAGDRFGVVFETYQSSPFWKAFDTLASSAKKLELGFSGFHAGALTEVYMVQNMVEFGPKKAMANFMKYIFADTAKNHELPCFANPQDFQEAATHLVKFGATNDYAAADVQNMFDNMRDAMMKVQEKLKDGNGISGTVAVATMPLKVVTQMLSLINKGMDRALWDFLHDGLKLATYRMRADKTKERAKKKGWSAEELSRALDEDGQFVNDMFGGQHWDVLGASHRTLRYAGRVLLSPDWNASTTRHFLALTGFGSIWNEATFENFKQYYQRLWHKELMPEDEGRRSRQISSLLCYGIGFMVFYEGIANGINAAFRALDEEKERKKAEEIRKTNPSYKSMYELAYGDEGMKWYDYLMRGNSLGQQSKIFMGRYEDGTEMYIRHGKQFREVPEYLFNHKGELEFPGPMVQRMIGKANPMVRMTLDDINYLSDFQASHADQEIQRKYGKTIGLLYKDALYWAPFLIPSQENKEFKAVDFFFPSSKGFSPWKAQSYFKDFILSGDMEGVVMTYQSCKRNGIDAEAQIKAAIGSVKALETAEMNDGVTSLQVACQRFDAAKSITEKKKMRQKMKKFLSQSDYKAFTQKEALDMVQGYLNGDEDLKEMEKAESKYLMAAKAEDVTEDWRIQNAWNGTMETYQEYQRLKDVDKAKANAFKNSKTNKRLFAARKAISAAKKKMNKAKKQMDGTNGAAKMAEIRKTRKELLNTLNGMD